MAVLEEQIKSCDHCDGMSKHGVTQAAPGYGSVRSPVVIVGQSLCEPCLETQIPFTGDSGKLLDASFAKVGIAKREALHHQPGALPSAQEPQVVSALEKQYVSGLARALTWGLRDVRRSPTG